MKYFTKLLFNLAWASVLTLISHPVYADGTHSHSHGDDQTPMVFEPTSTEFGSYEPQMQATQTIEVSMSDTMRFSPDVIKVKQGDVVMLTHSNTGAMMHEFVIGTEGSLGEHAEMMKKFPNMEHDEPYMIHVAAGKTGTMKWKFDKPGTFGFACLIPGHYDAGMKGKIIVE